MTLVVHAQGAYACYSHTEYKWRPDDHRVNKLVKALKGEPINGYSILMGVDGRRRQIDSKTPPAVAFELFGMWGAQRLGELNLGRVTLVGVPSSGCVDFTSETVPVRMAKAIALRSRGSAASTNWLHFSRAMPKSHDGGTRDKTTLERALVVSSRVTGRVVLVDDVKTTGAHLKACADALRSVGAVVEHAIVAGSTVWAPADTPLTVPPEDVEASPFDAFDDF